MEVVNAGICLGISMMLLCAPACGLCRALQLGAAGNSCLGFLPHFLRVIRRRVSTFVFRRSEGAKKAEASSKDADLHLRVEQIYEEQVQMRLHRWMQIVVMFVHPVGSLLMFSDALFYAKRGEVAPTTLSLSVVQFFPSLPAQLTLTYLFIRRRALTRGLFRGVFCCIVMAEALLVVWLGDVNSSTRPLEIQVLAMALGRLWITLTVRDGRFFVAVHGCLTLVYLVISVSPIGMLQPAFSLALALFNVLLCLSSFVIEREVKLCIRGGLEAQASQQYNRAAQNLLESLCDAVIELSQDYEVVHGYQRLAVMLLRQDVFAPRSSCNFMDVVANDTDKASFKAFIEASCRDNSKGNDGFATTMHITLRDSCSTSFPVQLYYACSVADSKNLTHMIGLRDAGDLMRHVPASDETMMHVESMLQQLAAPNLASQMQVGGLPSISEDVSSSASAGAGAAAASNVSAGNVLSRQPLRALRPGAGLGLPPSESSASSAEAPPNIVHIRGKAMVWVEMISLGMRRWTPEFLDLFGVSAVQEGASFLNLVLPDDRLSFLMNFQDLTKDMYYEEIAEDAPPPIEVRVDTCQKGPATAFGSLALAWESDFGSSALGTDRAAAPVLARGPAAPAPAPGAPAGIVESSKSPEGENVGEEEADDPMPLVRIALDSLRRLRKRNLAAQTQPRILLPVTTLRGNRTDSLIQL